MHSLPQGQSLNAVLKICGWHQLSPRRVWAATREWNSLWACGGKGDVNAKTIHAHGVKTCLAVATECWTQRRIVCRRCAPSWCIALQMCDAVQIADLRFWDVVPLADQQCRCRATRRLHGRRVSRSTSASRYVAIPAMRITVTNGSQLRCTTTNSPTKCIGAEITWMIVMSGPNSNPCVYVRMRAR